MSSPEELVVRAPRTRSLTQRLVAAAAVALMAITGAVVGAAPAHAIGEVMSGTVTAPSTSEPVEGIRIEIYTTAGGGELEFTYTDAAGFFHFDSIPVDGDYSLRFYDGRGDYEFATMYYPTAQFHEDAYLFNLTNTSNQVVNVELVPAGTASGEITRVGPDRQIHLNLFAYNHSQEAWQAAGNAYISDTSTEWTASGLFPGYYKVQFLESGASAYYSEQYYPNGRVLSDGEIIVVKAGADTSTGNAVLTTEGPSNVIRLAGQNRFTTSSRIAQELGGAEVVFVANGLGYADALSAAPAAALLGAPLLLTQKDSLPAAVKAEIVRLKPAVIYVVGGTGVVSASVFNELDALTTLTLRLAGSNRYTTSQAVFEEIWRGNAWSAPTVFLADGRNFPDALSAASAAAKEGGPVVLVNGGGSTLTTGLGDLFDEFDTTEVVLAGGTAVVSSGIENAVNDLPGTSALRLFGGNRYVTSFEINDHFFGTTAPVYLAVGTGYADALAGAALAGVQGGPLYIIPGHCVPQDVLDNITNVDTSRVVVLGGTGVLSAAVESLTSCTPTS